MLSIGRERGFLSGACKARRLGAASWPPLPPQRLAHRGAISTGEEALGGELHPRRRTSDFKHKLSLNRCLEFGAVADGDHESPRTPDNATLIVPCQGRRPEWLHCVAGCTLRW